MKSGKKIKTPSHKDAKKHARNGTLKYSLNIFLCEFCPPSLQLRRGKRLWVRINGNFSET
jgi:hypothetical protein